MGWFGTRRKGVEAMLKCFLREEFVDNVLLLLSLLLLLLLWTYQCNAGGGEAGHGVGI